MEITTKSSHHIAHWAKQLDDQNMIQLQAEYPVREYLHNPLPKWIKVTFGSHFAINV